MQKLHERICSFPRKGAQMGGSFYFKDYDEAKNGFRISVPDSFNFGFDVVDRHAADKSMRALLWVDDRACGRMDFSFEDISLQSNRYANVLRGLGVKKGDRIFIMLPRIPAWFSILVACHKLGAVVMPAPVLLMPSDIEYRLQRGRAAAVITDIDNLSKVEEALSRSEAPSLRLRLLVGGWKGGWIDLEDEASRASTALSRSDVQQTFKGDPFIIYFTSGTTGHPKMVLHNCTYPFGHLRTAGLWHGAGKDDLVWVVSDTGWAKSAWGLYGQWMLGAGIFVQNAVGKFDARLTLELMTTSGVTIFCGPPTVYRMLILQDLAKYDFSKIRYFASAGEPLNPEVIKVWHDATGRIIHEGFGQTETTLLIGNFPFTEVRPGSMGKSAPDLEISLLDEDYNPVPGGEVGYICVKVEPERPVGIFDGYLEDPGENAKAFQHGWYNTGDKAYMDRDGYFTFVGRGDDIIKASGYRIGPFEVESILQEHPAVAENAVVASPDPVRGEIVKAFIVLKPGYKASDDLVKDIQQFAKSRTAPYKYPREIEFMEELPKTTSGKIKRAVLRSREIERKRRAAHGTI